MLTLKKICLFVCQSVCLPQDDRVYDIGPKDKMTSHTMDGVRLVFCYCELFTYETLFDSISCCFMTCIGGGISELQLNLYCAEKYFVLRAMRLKFV